MHLHSKLHHHTATRLIKGYCDQGLLHQARQLFDEITTRDVVLWTAMISGYTSNGLHADAWAVFREMIGGGLEPPNAYTVSNVLKACKGMEWVLGGASVHALAIKHGLHRNIYVENALIDTYATSGSSMNDARMLFEGITDKTAVSWTTMIAGYTHRSDGMVGIQLFRRMLQEPVELNEFNCSITIRACASAGSLVFGKQLHAIAAKTGCEMSLAVGNSLMDFYCSCMCLVEAKQYFNEMPQRDMITWNTMIAGLERFSPQEALQLLFEMRSHNLHPNCFTFTSIIAGCTEFASLNFGQQLHGTIIRRGYEGNLPLANALIDMYSKCGSMADSQRVFNEMTHKDLVSWTTLMMGYGTHGYAEEAMELFAEMVVLGMSLDNVVFMGVISSCSHGGLVDEGLKYFNSMVHQYNVYPNQKLYGCVVDLLGRAGRIMEAYELIKSMPFEPEVSVWGALLGACKMHRKVEFGKLAAQKILSLKPDGAEANVTNIILSNIYAADSKWGEFAKTRMRLRKGGSRKEAGRSWIEVRDVVRSFVVGEQFDPELKVLYEELHIFLQHMQEVGYVPDADCSVGSLEGIT